MEWYNSQKNNITKLPIFLSGITGDLIQCKISWTITVKCDTQDIDHLLNFIYLFIEHILHVKNKSEVNSAYIMEPTVIA